MRMINEIFDLSNDSVELKAFLNAEESDFFQFPVADISKILVKTSEYHDSFQEFKSWLNRENVQFSTVKIPHSFYKESIALQENQFYFMELNYKPYFLAQNVPLSVAKESDIHIERATEKDLPDIFEIITHSFRYERFHIDPIIGPDLANKRYAYFVQKSLIAENQIVYKFMFQDKIIGFFSVLYDPSKQSAHWLLTALHRDYHSKGLGKRIWQAMMRFHIESEKLTKITTSISSQNIIVLNLYASLGFKFEAPIAVYHWAKKS